MAKSSEFPTELRHFAKILNSFHAYHDYDVFIDFIDFAVGCLLWKGDPDTAERLKRKYKNQYELFGKMYLALIHTMKDNIHTDQCWYDVPGTLYECISMRSKSSALGQFFTPAPICNFIAKIQADDQPVGKYVNDPAAGSSRMLLAFNAFAPGNILIAQDIDHICTKMSAINLALHGCKGQSVNGDALWPDSYNFGFSINPRLHLLGGFPHIIPLKKENSISYQIWQNQLKEIPAKEIPQTPDQLPAVSGTPVRQLSLFDM